MTHSSVHSQVAIVGMGCRFPGGVIDVESFWKLLNDGRDAIVDIPSDRFDVGRFFDDRPATPGRINIRRGGFVGPLDTFDADFFGISPREAERIDPQQRLLLETAWEALEDAGQDVYQLDGSRTGVFIGQWSSDFESRLFADPEAVDFYMTMGSGRYAASGRLSYIFGLRGPSLTLDTACSSALAAVHLAVRSLRSRECELALVGGANVILQPHITIAYSQGGMMAPDGRCKFGDASGDGYVRSEGVGVVVLKPLERALADKDRIYALIAGSALNNDGSSSGSMGRPSRTGQEELLRAAYQDAGLPPARVTYVEAHGTGTRAGDPVELGALGAVVGVSRSQGDPVYVGSVKTNIGHTEAAAGVAGLVKTALALERNIIPPSLHCDRVNPKIPWGDLPFEIPRSPIGWPKGRGHRVAGVSAYGISGTNVHVVLKEAPAVEESTTIACARPVALLPLSARNAQALRELATRYADLLDGTTDLHHICCNAATRRTALEQRAVFVAADGGGMGEALRGYANGAAPMAQGVVQRGASPKVAFVLPGQGAQWMGMARNLVEREPAFRAALEDCDRVARRYVDWSILTQLTMEASDPSCGLNRIEVIQPVLCAVSIAYSALWRSLGVEPHAVVGHSMGEVAAAHIAGVLDLDQAMRIICRRSALMAPMSGKGAMAFVEVPMDEISARLGCVADRVSAAVSNSPRSCVISGDPEAVQEVVAGLERDGVFCRLVKVEVASHSPQMDAVAVALRTELSDLTPRSQTIPIVSTVFARYADGSEFGAEYWASNVRRPVRFAEAVERLLGDGVKIFVELGPHPVLVPSVEQTVNHVPSSEAVAVACGQRDENDQAAMLSALARLWTAGYPVNWRRVFPQARPDVRLPLYPWQRQRYWVDAAKTFPDLQGAKKSILPPDEPTRRWLYRLCWKACDVPLHGHNTPNPTTHWVVVGNNTATQSAVAAAFSAAGENVEAVSLDSLSETLGQLSHSPGLGVIVLPGEGPGVPYLPIAVTQEVLRAKPAAPIRLWFLTNCGQSAEPLACVSVEQGALWGAARVVAEEHPQLWGGLVDMDPADELRASTQHLVSHLRADDGEDQVALRSGRRFVLRLQADDSEPIARSPIWQANAAYLITGGFGDVGLHVARAIAQQGARRIVLLGRTQLPPRSEWAGVDPTTSVGRRIMSARALEAAGVAIHTAAVDVGNEAELRAFLDRYRAEGWPPIRGVIHAAGSFDNRLITAMDRASFDSVLRSKLHGAQLLDRLLPDLDLFVLFSSSGAFVAQSGQANYAAANAGLDEIALNRRARGQSALSVAWGIWKGTGLIKDEAGQINVSHLAHQGIGSFTPEQGTALFSWLCGFTDATIAVLPIDWAIYTRTRAGRSSRLFNGVGGVANGAVTEGLSEKLASAEPSARRQLLEAAVRDATGRVLKIAPAHLDPRKPFGAMGLNSLLAMELRNRLEAALSRPLSATLAWNYPTIDALVEYLEQPAAKSVSQSSRVIDHETADRGGATVELSDEEAIAALRGARWVKTQ